MTFPFPFLSVGEKPIVTAWQMALLTNASVGGANTVRQCIASGLSGSGSQMRVTFAAPTTGSITIDAARIGTTTPSVDVNNVFDSAPKQLFFGGSSTVVLSGGVDVTSDWADFAYLAPKALLLAFHMAAAGTDRRRNSPGGNHGMWWRGGADDSASLPASGYTWGGFIISTITKIEVR